jgi:hypothetical protein
VIFSFYISFTLEELSFKLHKMPFYCLNNISTTLKLLTAGPPGRQLYKNDKIKKVSESNFFSFYIPFNIKK